MSLPADPSPSVHVSSPEVVAALAALPQAGSVRLGRLLHERGPADAWALVAEGRVPIDVAPAAVRHGWRTASRSVVLDDLREHLDTVGVHPTSWHDAAHPPRFSADIDPAPVAFRSGRLPAATLPHVAIIGTRRASTIGREIARELGAGLAAEGVVVVSGLALGIDGAAHRGALLGDGAPPVAVVGSGADVVYPAAHRELWGEIATAGAVLTEAPLGARPDAWRFPARNRLIAALADLVVVVESRAAGGSLLTVEQAMRRGIDVMAVPGSVRNAAAIGTNQLLADGCAPVRDVDDVLVALGLGRATMAARRATPARPACSPEAVAVLEAIDDGPTSVDQLVERLGFGVGEIHLRLGELSASGLVVHDGARVRRA
jgi:DNA processing protein